MNPETQLGRENQGVGKPRPATEVLAGAKLDWLNNYRQERQEVEAVFEEREPADRLCLIGLDELRHRPNPGDEGLGEEIDSLASGFKGGAKDLGELGAAAGGSVLGAVSAAVFPKNINLQQMLLETMRRTGQIELGNEAAEDREIEQKLVIVVGNDQIRATSTLLEKALGRMEIEIGQGNLSSAEELKEIKAGQSRAGAEKLLQERGEEVWQTTQGLRKLAALKLIQEALNRANESLPGKEIEKLKKRAASLVKKQENYFQPKLCRLAADAAAAAIDARNLPIIEKKDLPFWGLTVEYLGIIGGFNELKDILKIKRQAIWQTARYVLKERNLSIEDRFIEVFSPLDEVFERVINEESVAEIMLEETSQSAFEVWRENHPLPDIKAEIREPDLEEEAFDLPDLPDEESMEASRQKTPKPAAKEEGDDEPDWLRNIRRARKAVQAEPEKTEEPEPKTPAKIALTDFR